MPTIEISLAVIALAFVVLVIYLLVVLNSTKKTLDQLSKVMKNVEITTVNVNQKMIAMDSLFLAISNLGDKALSATNKLKGNNAEENLDDSSFRLKSEANGRVDHLMDLLSLGVSLWKVYKNKGGSK